MSIVTNEFHASHAAHSLETHKHVIQFDRSSACGNECANDSNLRARLIFQQRLNGQNKASFWTQESIITTNKMIQYVHESNVPKFLRGGMVSTDTSPKSVHFQNSGLHMSTHQFLRCFMASSLWWLMRFNIPQVHHFTGRSTCIGQWHLVSLGMLRRGWTANNNQRTVARQGLLINEGWLMAKLMAIWCLFDANGYYLGNQNLEVKNHQLHWVNHGYRWWIVHATRLVKANKGRKVKTWPCAGVNHCQHQLHCCWLSNPGIDNDQRSWSSSLIHYYPLVQLLINIHWLFFSHYYPLVVNYWSVLRRTCSVYVRMDPLNLESSSPSSIELWSSRPDVIFIFFVAGFCDFWMDTVWDTAPNLLRTDILGYLCHLYGFHRKKL